MSCPKPQLVPQPKTRKKPESQYWANVFSTPSACLQASSCKTLPQSYLPPTLARVPSGGGTTGSKEGQGLKGGLVEEWDV